MLVNLCGQSAFNFANASQKNDDVHVDGYISATRVFMRIKFILIMYLVTIFVLGKQTVEIGHECRRC